MENLTSPSPSYEEWLAEVEAIAKADGKWIENEIGMLSHFEHGLTPRQAYEEDEIDRCEMEDYLAAERGEGA